VYRLEIAPAADRELDKLKGRISREDYVQLRTAVRSLAKDPRPHGVRKITGSEKAYRIRTGNYRVVYEIYDGESLILILHVSRRSETTYH
jgi:mRNA interferase RelE/StbE